MDKPDSTPAHPGVNLDPAFALRITDLFREHNRALVAFLQCRLNSLSDAQEVAQEAYVRLVTMERPEQVDSLRAYLFRVASNLAVDRLRARQVRADNPIEVPDDDLHLAPIPERHVHATGQLQELYKALRELPAKTGRAFVMHVIEGREISAIARAMKISERMVRYHVANALAHCRARVDEPEMP
ncbi:RNA polymerase sigma-70 factor, ECF subfamily [Dyella jiangningensis]|uniref:RNA polymerase sigma factor n=2 Tax=Gammaproteobacteria TaxID=1236 RepID=UPI00088A46A9|nr:sigma-70 family RNA polymerase sigma factor [Dyella sp. AtDHG13]PXV59219.1 RNA polymerase sigma-70 factor (ECF subfamily) [Dyella sp. AtDHG13]SDK26323.1 RNA polymerase sigma-70 factor, ECF subfamily [Dyella jiangningensis]